MLKEDFKVFKREIEKRKISGLFHFTPTIHLFGIFELGGLVSRAELEKLGKHELTDCINYPDKLRLDGKKDYINLSITKPNYFLLKDKKNRYRNDPTMEKWCIIEIDPKYIYYRDTMFSVTNAASTAARKIVGIDGKFETFKKIFAEEIDLGYKKIPRDNKPPNVPTDIQAEVLVKDKIKIEDFISIYFENKEDLVITKQALKIIDEIRDKIDFSIFKVDPKLFKAG